MIQPPWIEITTVLPCMNQCSYCPQAVLSEAYKGTQILTLDGFKSILANIPKEVTVNFAGMSEPFQNPDCADMIIYAYEQGYKVHVNTTLVGVSTETLDRLDAVEFVQFRLHNIGQKLPMVKPWFSSFDTIDNPTNRAGNLDYDLVRKPGDVMCSRSKDYTCNVMLPNGDVVLCCCDYGCKHVLGNLYDTHYNDLPRANSYELCNWCNFSYYERIKIDNHEISNKYVG